MAKVIALIPDLLFGSRVQAALKAAGHEIELSATREDVPMRLRQPEPPEVLIVDLTDERLQGPELVEALRARPPSKEQAFATPKTLGFYSHVDAATRERAQRAGFDLVVARSRMAREAAALVERLAGESGRLA